MAIGQWNARENSSSQNRTMQADLLISLKILEKYERESKSSTVIQQGRKAVFIFAQLSCGSTFFITKLTSVGHDIKATINCLDQIASILCDARPAWSDIGHGTFTRSTRHHFGRHNAPPTPPDLRGTTVGPYALDVTQKAQPVTYSVIPSTNDKLDLTVIKSKV